MNTFEDYVSARRFLQNVCDVHATSLAAFFDPSDQRFRLHAKPPLKLGGTEEPRHLTTSATCFESLQSCPTDVPGEIATSAGTFASWALKLKHEDWKSGGSAEVYCRCRALLLIIRESPA